MAGRNRGTDLVIPAGHRRGASPQRSPARLDTTPEQTVPGDQGDQPLAGSGRTGGDCSNPEQRQYDENDEDREENPELDDRDARCSARDASEAECSGNQRDDQKNEGPFQHTASAPFWVARPIEVTAAERSRPSPVPRGVGGDTAPDRNVRSLARHTDR